MTRLTCLLAGLFLSLSAAASAAGPAKLKVALTFDDLPLNGALPAGTSQSDITRASLAVLKKHHIPPSFGFINAKKLERNPDGALALKLWVAAGNPVGNHTYSHLDLTTNSAEAFEREVLQNEPALELLTPQNANSSWRWLRYPYLHEGETLEKRRAVRSFLQVNGYRVAQTTLDYEDYLWNSAYAQCVVKQDEDAIRWLRESYLGTAADYIHVQRDLARQIFGRDIAHVLLLHLGAFSAQILPDLFELLKKEGFEIVTLEEAQSDAAYDIDPDVASKGGGTLTELLLEARGIGYPKVADKPREKLRSLCL